MDKDGRARGGTRARGITVPRPTGPRHSPFWDAGCGTLSARPGSDRRQPEAAADGVLEPVTRSCPATSPVTKPRRSRPPCSTSRSCRRCRPSRSRRRRADAEPPARPARRSRGPGRPRPPRVISRSIGADSSRPSVRRDVEAGHRARGAVPVDGRRPPRGAARRVAVDHVGVAGAGRVRERPRSGRRPRPRAGGTLSRPVRSATRGELGLAQPDVEVEAERPADLLAQERAPASGRRPGARPRRPGGRRAAPTRPHAVPGSQRGCCAASSAHIRSQSRSASAGAGSLEHDDARTWWLSTWRSVVARRPSPASTSPAARRGPAPRGRRAPARTRPRTAWSPSTASPGCPRPTAACRPRRRTRPTGRRPSAPRCHTATAAPVAPAASCSSSTASNTSRTGANVGGRRALGVHAPMVAASVAGCAPTDLFTVASRANVPPFHVMDLLAAAARAAAQPRRPAQPGRRASRRRPRRCRCARRPSGRSTSRCSATPSRSASPSCARRSPATTAGCTGSTSTPTTSWSPPGRPAASCSRSSRPSRPGDRVAIARPGYACYRNVLTALGCEVVELAGRTGDAVPADRRDARGARRAGAGAGGRQPRQPHRHDAGARASSPRSRPGARSTACS